MRTKASLILVLLILAFSTPLFGISNKEKIAEVKSGKIKEARVEWWGFDKNDSTEALRKAINSGASKIIVSKMDSPWLIKPVQLQSNQEIVFEKGVVVRALPGAYKNIYDCLFQARGKKNIILRGDAVLMMNKKDYQDKTQYKLSEWRHAISLLSCENIKIIGLTIKNSGGDGVYVGVLRGKNKRHQSYCKNILIDKVICDNNHRQGITVISVENLLIRDSQMNNTAGTAPMAGIDFEPNCANERLVNCVMENCSFEGNKVYGFLIYSTLSDKSKPISISLRNCSIKGGGLGIVIKMNPRIKNPANGFVKFINCRVENSADAGIELKNFRSNGWKVIFEDCKLQNTAVKQPGRSPIMISLSSKSNFSTGNVEFKNCKVVDKMKRPLMQFNNLSGKQQSILEKLIGTLAFNGHIVDMTEYVKKNKLDIVNLLEMTPLEQKALFPQGGYDLKKRRKLQPRLILRGKTRFLIAADKGKNVKFNLQYNRIRGEQNVMKVVLIAPSGKKIKLKNAILGKNNSYSFTALEKGVYIMNCNPGVQKLRLTDCNSPFSLAMPEEGALSLFRPRGRVYFGIPAGIKEFSIEISGESAETLSAQIYVGSLRVASADHISAPKVFSIKCSPGKKLRFGSIVFNKAIEDSRIRIIKPLLPIFSANKAELMISSQKIAP